GNMALQQAGGTGGSGTSTSSTGTGGGNVQNVAATAQGAARDSKLTAEKFNKINDDYEKAISEINKNRRESLKKLASGALETATLPAGAIGGLTVGLATGDNPLKAAGVGIGAT